MISRILRKSTLFYQISVAVCFFGTLGVILNYWYNGTLKQNETNNIFEVSFMLKNLEKGIELKRVENLALSSNLKKSIEELELLKNKTNFINNQLPQDEYEQLDKSLNTINKGLVGILSYPDRTELLSVLRDRVVNFNKFVSENKWRTLTRVSDSLIVKLKTRRNNISILKNKYKASKNSVEQLKAITERSVLTRHFKSAIIAKLSLMDKELSMLSKYINSVEKLKADIQDTSKRFKNWLELISGDVNENLEEKNKETKKFIFSLLSVLGISFIFFSLGFFTNKHWIRNGQRELEANMVEIIEAVVRNKRVVNEEDFSNGFIHSVEKNMNYAQKRMNFGFIFQETLPIPGILLDNNLKVIWANNTFCDTWGVSDQKIASSYLSWDLLKKQTNLDEQSPILEAIKNNIAGIYQISVISNETSKRTPYEMYVRPIEFRGEKSVMLYFYPLNFMEETIKQQSLVTLTPIRKSLEMIVAKDFSHERLNKLKDDFKEAGAEDLYMNFRKAFDILDDAIQNFNDQRNFSENLNSNFVNKTSELTELLDTQGLINRKAAERIMELRDRIVEYSSIKEDIYNNALEDLTKLKKVSNAFTKLNKNYEENFEKVQNLSNVIDNIEITKDQSRKVKLSLSENFNRIITLINTGRTSDIANYKDKLVEEIKQFEKSQTELDVHISKATMIAESISNIESSVQIPSESEAMKRDQEYLSYHSKTINLEDQIVDTIKDVYDCMKDNQNSNSKAQRVLTVQPESENRANA